MSGYIFRRLLKVIPTILFVVTVIFFAVRSLTGDPAVALLGEDAGSEAIAKMREHFGLNESVFVQYFETIRNLLMFDLGEDVFRQLPVIEILARPFYYTIELTIAGTLLGALMGIPLGIISALNWRSTLDATSRLIALLGFSFPTFFVGIVLLYVFAFKLRWFPLLGGGDYNDFWDRMYHLFLPALTLGIIKASFVMRLTRSNMLTILQEDYIITARSKGLSEFIVVGKHALRNTLLVVITMTFAYMIFTLGGTIALEIVFNRPGIGVHLVHAIAERNYAVIQGGLILLSVGVVVINLVTDILYTIIDPRISYDNA
ncbi:MAG: glutathione ABC transporter permease [Hyphomicrobiales bacterium]|nr:MAG: glutathione ABC transporter permease [Hyphomicrobiales bacterium]